MSKIVGIIPARYESSRFPGKPLVDIAGKPMIQRVVERANSASLLSKVIVATDDVRIQEHVLGFGGECVMTTKEIQSGTDRAALVANDLDADIVINIQGDEPLIEPDEIDQVAKILIENKDVLMGTLVKRITNCDDLINPNTAKVIMDTNGNAIYFSRSPIPFYRDIQDKEKWLEKHTYFKHVGIYSYRKDFLLKFSTWRPSILEKAEKLEQLRALEMGYQIHVTETTYEPICVDTPEDLEKVREIIELEFEQNQIQK